jgi:hypothetical protein
MSDIEPVLQSTYRNPDAVKYVVAGSIPIGDDYEIESGPERLVYESFVEGAVPAVTWTEDQPKKRPAKRGRPKKKVNTDG